MNTCIFCEIVAGAQKSNIVYQDDKVVAFLDLYPISKGHTLVIPREHFSDLTDIADDVLRDLIVVSKQLAAEYKTKLGADGFNIRQNNGAVAHQEIFHFHLHLVPRYHNDMVDLSYSDRDETLDLDQVHRLIQTT